MKWLLPLFFFACSGDKGDTAATCDPGDPAAGQLSAELDGAAWTADLTYTWAGESLQFASAPVDGWHLTIVAQSANGGDSLKTVVDGGALPAEVVLQSAKGGFAVLYPDSGASASTNDGDGGTLVITEVVDEDVIGCIDFSAAGEDGAHALRAGTFRASPG